MPVVNSADYHVNDNLLTLVTPGSGNPSFLDTNWQSGAITISTTAQTGQYELQLMGIVSLDVGTQTGLYLPFAHDPILLVSTGGGGNQQ